MFTVDTNKATVSDFFKQNFNCMKTFEESVSMILADIINLLVPT